MTPKDEVGITLCIGALIGAFIFLTGYAIEAIYLLLLFYFIYFIVGLLK